MARLTLLIAGSSLVLAACSDGGDSSPTGPPDEQEPVASLTVTPSEGHAPLPVEIELECSDPDGSIAEHRVDLDGDDEFDVVGGPVRVSLVLVAPVTVRGQCVDDEGATSPVVARDVDVEVAPPVQPEAVLPVDWTIPVGERVRFRTDTPEASLVWSVNGVAGGSDDDGTIDGEGIYTAPGGVPASGTVEVSAVEEETGTSLGSATVHVVDDLGELTVRETYTTWTPRVVSPGSADSVTMDVAFLQGYPDSVSLDLGARGDFRSLLPVRTGTWRLRLATEEVLSRYRTGELHAFVGFLSATGPDGPTGRLNVFTNVLTDAVPRVEADRLAEDVQAGPHVVNIRWDPLFLADPIPPEMSRRFYELFPDDFDFLAIVEQVNSPHNRSYRGVRGDEEGIGRSATFDRTDEFGSAGRLRGFIDFPTSTFFDLASPSGVHEIAHRWMAFIEVEGLSIRIGAHWAPGTAAVGIIGSSGSGGQGIPFPYELVSVGPHEHELRCVDRRMEFNDLELYLMGLLPADSVGTHVVFDDPEIELACGSRGTTVPFTIEDVVATNGMREPAYPEAPRDFRLATIVLSRGRLLTRDELSFFDHMAARGEERDELPYTEGFVRGVTKPFYLATGGRGTLSTSVRK